MFVADLMANVLKLLLYIAVAVVMVYSRGYLRGRDLYRGEFFVLALFATLGMMVMISANHLLTLYLGWSCSRCRSTAWSRCSATRRSPPKRP